MPPRHLKVCLLAVFIFIYIAEMSFHCIHPCNGSYGTRPGLSRHQNGCPIFRTAQALKIENRRLMKSKVPSSIALGGKATSAATSLDARKARISHQGSKFLVSSLAACEVMSRMNNNGLCTSHPVVTPRIPVTTVFKSLEPLHLWSPHTSNLQSCTRQRISSLFLRHFLQRHFPTLGDLRDTLEFL